MQHVNRVRKQVRDCLQRFRRTLRTSWKIHHQSFCAAGRNSSRQNCRRRFFQASAAHFFWDSGNYPIGDRLRGLRRIVSRTDSSSTGSQNQIDAAGVSPFRQPVTNCAGIVRGSQRGNNFPAKTAAKCHHGRPGQIFAFTSRHGITDSEDGYSHRRVYLVSTASWLASSINRMASISRPVVFLVVVLRVDAFAALKSISNSPSVHKMTL